MVTETLMGTVTSLLEVVLIVVLPVAAAYAGKLLKDFIKSYSQKINNDYFKTMFSKIADTLEAAVTSTSQTYVNTLKEQGGFGMDEQKEALKRTMDTAKKLLSKEAQDLIVQTHGDLDLWIKTQVEAFVHDQGIITAGFEATE